MGTNTLAILLYAKLDRKLTGSPTKARLSQSFGGDRTKVRRRYVYVPVVHEEQGIITVRLNRIVKIDQVAIGES